VISGKVRNKDRLYAKLKRLAPEAAAALTEEANKAADEMVSTAKAYAPVDDGDLRDSIVATRTGQMTPAYSQPGGSQVVPEGSVLVTAGNTKARYPHLVEYGTRPHTNQGMFPGTQHPGTVAQPFFWVSFRLLRKRFRGRMTRAMNKAIKKVASK
jgi:HK97 gp10 family phage protein